MIGEQIKKFRAAQGMTQQNLAEKLFVTAQAVSRWENGEVEPSLGTITEMAKIFGVTTDEMLGMPAPEKAEAPAPEVIVEKEYVVKEAPPVLAVCEKCNRPIYKGNEIVRYTTGGGRTASVSHVKCVQCDKKEKEARARYLREKAAHRRMLSYILGSLAAAAVLLVMIFAVGAFQKPEFIALGVIAPIGAFTLVSCLLFANNFVGDMICSIAGFSIRMPGLIFSLDLDGIVWLLTVKLALWILGALLSLFCLALGIALGLVVSIFVYPYALVKIIKNPEECDFD